MKTPSNATPRTRKAAATSKTKPALAPAESPRARPAPKATPAPAKPALKAVAAPKAVAPAPPIAPIAPSRPGVETRPPSRAGGPPAPVKRGPTPSNVAVSGVARYFERSRPQGNQFWELILNDAEVQVRTGNSGELGKTTTRSYPSPAAAAADAAAQIQRQISAGQKELTGEVLWLPGQGKRPMLARVPLDSEKLVLGFSNMPQERLDLRELGRLRQLTELTLRGHKLVELDLTPIASCAVLRKLRLSDTGLTSIDLTPLSQSGSLETFELMHLKATVDLSGLAGCARLSTLNLMNNLFTEIDLTPLARVASLSVLQLQNCPNLERLDLRPLRGHRTLQLITVDSACEVLGEKEIKAEVRRF